MKFNPYDNLLYPSSDRVPPELYKAEKLQQAQKVNRKNSVTDKHQKKHNPQKQSKETNLKHFKELSDAVLKAHEKLIKTKNPYRFCVYLEGEEIMIDIVKTNDLGKIESIVKKDITRDDFFKWIECIETGDGLVLDKEV